MIARVWSPSSLLEEEHESLSAYAANSLEQDESGVTVMVLGADEDEGIALLTVDVDACALNHHHHLGVLCQLLASDLDVVDRVGALASGLCFVTEKDRSALHSIGPEVEVITNNLDADDDAAGSVHTRTALSVVRVVKRTGIHSVAPGSTRADRIRVLVEHMWVPGEVKSISELHVSKSMYELEFV
eukprot:CAMPEP_0167789724 /NCGR_PEP_ID=MMETSP0111_2-20121227/10860_1 /TAXON_ID=91324 /ORGANISM="Lotharella globosa, Strain CCCM811" /LENGTH=185 /DNA_ID=CAMNT_0007681955 /DNA_START=461 /DNA_END=1014 /DNA_ORIENTATION=+